MSDKVKAAEALDTVLARMAHAHINTCASLHHPTEDIERMRDAINQARYEILTALGLESF